MKVSFANDHAAVDARDAIVEEIRRLGHEVEDCGAHGPDSVDYPDYAAKALAAWREGRVDRVVLMCGTGLGMSYVGNKTPGVRCALCTDEYAAEMSRLHNNANCLALRAREQDPEMNLKVLRIFLETSFEGGRHQRRVEKIDQIAESMREDAE